MVAMITGAKRYILSPPRACSKLGIFTSKTSPIYRHSLLNFAHIPLAKDYHNQMSQEERAWLGRASTAEAIDTVVKAGEVSATWRRNSACVVLERESSVPDTYFAQVLYIPSFYFHYIVSLQVGFGWLYPHRIERIDLAPLPFLLSDTLVSSCLGSQQYRSLHNAMFDR
jgi:hypothetical protein